MLGFPASTEFGKRIPKQKFYENLDVSPTLRRVFVDQIRLLVVDLDKIIKGAGKQKTSTIHLNLLPAEANEISSIFMEFTDNVHMSSFFHIFAYRLVCPLIIFNNQNFRH